MAQLYEIGQVVGFIDLANWERNQPAEPVISDSAKWFCVTTNPNCQARAALELYALGFRTFLPKVRKWVTHARIRKAVEKPLLGRYLFVEVDHPRQSFGAVRLANGIEGFVANPDPVPIPARFVNDFRHRYMTGEWDFVTREPCPEHDFDEKGRLQIANWRRNSPLPLGARIRIVEGEFHNMLATVTQRKGNRIDFKLFGENRYGRLNECSVRAA